MNFNQKKQKINFIWQTLILQNCWPVSQPAKFTSKNLTQHLLGSRTAINVFKYDHLRHLLLKLSPLIRTLFNTHLKLQNKIGRYTYYVPPTPPRDPSKLEAWQKRMKDLNIKRFKKMRHYYKTIEKPKPIKILFATTTPIYSEIIESAADLCNMPFHTNRWLCGALTANARYLKEIIKSENSNPEPDQVTNVTSVHSQFFKKYQTNKEVPEKRYAWHQLQKKSKRPTMVVIPDIHNNDMILRETNPLNIPVIGLVNSSCATQVTYPIFGNANSVEIVHFFCHFLAVLIAKEVIQQDYKNKSHRIFAKTRWLLQKDSVKIPRSFSKDRLTRLPIRRSPRLQIQNQRTRRTLRKKKIKNRIRTKNIKNRLWIKNTLIRRLTNLTNAKILKKKQIKNYMWTRTRTRTRKIQASQILWKKKRRSISKNFFYKQFDIQRKKAYGRLHFHKRKLRKTRKQANKVTAHRFFVQKNVQWLIFDRKYYPRMTNWKARAWTTLNLTFKLLLIFQHPNLNQKKMAKFFKNNSTLTYLAYSFLQQVSKTRSRDSRKALFFEFHVNQKKNQPIPFSLPAWKKELVTTNESIWRNAYWTYFRTQNKKKRSSAFSRRRINNQKNKRKFRGKVRLVRRNKPYNWRSTKTLVTKHRIKHLTRLWTKTQNRIYRDLRSEFWTQIAWYFDKKKRKKFWVKWRVKENINYLHRILKFKVKRGWKKKNIWKNNFQKQGQNLRVQTQKARAPRWIEIQKTEKQKTTPNLLEQQASAAPKKQKWSQRHAPSK